MRKRKFKKKQKGKEEVALQITSMADIFTILLVFLLKSFSTDAATVTPHNEMVLPEAKKVDALVEVLKIEISKNIVMVDDKAITELKEFTYDPTDLESNGTVRSLNTVLIQQRKKDTLQKYPKVMILADQKTPFSTVRRVLASASESGFEDFKLAVVEDR